VFWQIGITCLQLNCRILLLMPKPRVILIAGAAHGGTTIANMILGQHPEIFATGKLRGFPEGGMFSERNVCSCGDKAATCRFWSDIRTQFQAYSGMPDQEKFPALYRLISELSGRQYIGDVTHSVAYAEMLHGLKGIDLYLVHLVRDGRGVVYSRIRKDIQAGSLGDSAWQRLRWVAKVSKRWSSQVGHLGRLEKALGAKAVRVSYEALCKDPQASLSRIGSSLGLNFGMIGQRLADGQPMLPMPHMLRGNAKLRARNDVVLRRDVAYLSEMPRIDQATFHLVSKLSRLFI
jgi:hypothetical protein